MGAFQPVSDNAAGQNEGPPATPLTTLVRDERCDNCSWPDTCAADRTCWKDESRTSLERQVAAAAQAEREALDRMDAGEPQESSALEPPGVAAPGPGADDEADDPAAAAIARAREAEQARVYPTRKGKWPKDGILDRIRVFNLDHGRPPTAAEWAKAAPDRPTTAIVYAQFGSWADAIEQAGFPRPTRGRRIKIGTLTGEGGVNESSPTRRSADVASAASSPGTPAAASTSPPAASTPPRARPLKRGWIAVGRTGLCYRTPTEGYAAADELEHHAEDEARALRHDGHDAQAEKVADRARERADLIRAAMREAERRASGSGPSDEEAKPEAELDSAGIDLTVTLREFVRAGRELLDAVDQVLADDGKIRITVLP